MKTNKLLFVLMIGLSSAIAVSCSQQTITPAQMRQNIIDDAMKPENYKDLKQDLAFLESQGLLQPHSFYNLLEENVTESDDATFNEVIEKAEDLLTEHMRGPFISRIGRALDASRPLDEYINSVANPVITYVMQHKDNDMALHNIVRGWLLAWSEIRDSYGRAPLYIAAEKGHLEIVRFLFEYGINADIQRIDIGITPLYIASENGHQEIAQILLEYGADVNSQRTDTGTNSLYMASENGHKEIVQILLEYGADVNIQRTYIGTTSLYMASQNGHKEIVQILIEHGADVNSQRTDIGLTPLHIAADQGHTEIVQILVTAGADINIRNHDGQLAEDLATTDEIRDILRRVR